MLEKQRDRQRKTKWKSCGNETNRRERGRKYFSVFLFVESLQIMSVYVYGTSRVCFSTWLPRSSFLSLSDRNTDGEMNTRWQRRRSERWTAFSCFSGEKWRFFALESRHKDNKGSRLKQIFLSWMQTCCSPLADYYHKEKSCIWKLREVFFCIPKHCMRNCSEVQLSSVMTNLSN